MCISGRKNSLCMKFLRLKRVKNWKQSSGTGEWRTTSVQFSSVTQSCTTLCDPMNRSTPGLPVRHQLLEFTQSYIHWVDDAIQPSHPVVRFSSCLQPFPASASFPMNQLFTSGGQSIRVSASMSVLPMNTQDWSPLGWAGWLSWLHPENANPVNDRVTGCVTKRWPQDYYCILNWFLT